MPVEKEYFKARPWVSRQKDDDQDVDLIAELAKQTGLSDLVLKLCLSRNLKTTDQINQYLAPKFESLTSPLTIRDMDIAVERLARARENSEKVLIFGDYDVDGTSGAALLSWVFRDFKIQSTATQPDRFKDGYGLNVGRVDQAGADGVKVLVTVDCGISSFDAAVRAKELGIDLIIVDHHQIDPVRGLPPATAVINPQRADCGSGLKQLCGCGLAFYVAIALRTKGRSLGWFEGVQEPNLKQHLDLVVLATAADMVPLVGDNRILVSHGMEVLKSTKKPGLKALMDVAGITGKSVSPGHLGFVLGPRINASGRMQSACLALELLTTLDPEISMKIARTLEELNSERAELQNRIWDDVRAKVEQGIQSGIYPHAILIADESWHEGVVGIVASRVTETFRRPAAVIAIKTDQLGQKIGKGSVRSYGGKDVLGALRKCERLLLGYGGHRFAAGLSTKAEGIDELNRSFNQAVEEATQDKGAQTLSIESECTLEDLNLRTLQELERFAPFGPGNPEPVYAIRAGISWHSVLKGRHLKLRLLESVGEVPLRSKTLDAIWFHAAERADIMSVLEDKSEQASHGKRQFSWAGVPELNRFAGSVTPSFRLKDWKP